MHSLLETANNLLLECLFSHRVRSPRKFFGTWPKLTSPKALFQDSATWPISVSKQPSPLFSMTSLSFSTTRLRRPCPMEYSRVVGHRPWPPREAHLTSPLSLCTLRPGSCLCSPMHATTAVCLSCVVMERERGRWWRVPNPRRRGVRSPSWPLPPCHLITSTVIAMERGRGRWWRINSARRHHTCSLVWLSPLHHLLSSSQPVDLAMAAT